MRNLKLVIAFLCVCASAHTQIGYNLTHTFDPNISIHTSVIEKNDTLIIFGINVSKMALLGLRAVNPNAEYERKIFPFWEKNHATSMASYMITLFLLEKSHSEINN
jgi:hypothetical protein